VEYTPGSDEALHPAMTWWIIAFFAIYIPLAVMWLVCMVEPVVSFVFRKWLDN